MAGPLFATDSPDQILQVGLDGLITCFHRRSGTTHLLAPPAPEILDVLAEGPAAIPTILSRLKRRFDVGGRNAKASLEARLAELEQAGLIWRL